MSYNNSSYGNSYGFGDQKPANNNNPFTANQEKLRREAEREKKFAEEKIRTQILQKLKKEIEAQKEKTEQLAKQIQELKHDIQTLKEEKEALKKTIEQDMLDLRMVDMHINKIKTEENQKKPIVDHDAKQRADLERSVNNSEQEKMQLERQKEELQDKMRSMSTTKMQFQREKLNASQSHIKQLTEIDLIKSQLQYIEKNIATIEEQMKELQDKKDIAEKKHKNLDMQLQEKLREIAVETKKIHHIDQNESEEELEERNISLEINRLETQIKTVESRIRKSKNDSELVAGAGGMAQRKMDELEHSLEVLEKKRDEILVRDKASKIKDSNITLKLKDLESKIKLVELQFQNELKILQQKEQTSKTAAFAKVA